MSNPTRHFAAPPGNDDDDVSPPSFPPRPPPPSPSSAVGAVAAAAALFPSWACFHALFPLAAPSSLVEPGEEGDGDNDEDMFAAVAVDAREDGEEEGKEDGATPAETPPWGFQAAVVRLSRASRACSNGRLD